MFTAESFAFEEWNLARRRSVSWFYEGNVSSGAGKSTWTVKPRNTLVKSVSFITRKMNTYKYMCVHNRKCKKHPSTLPRLYVRPYGIRGVGGRNHRSDELSGLKIDAILAPRWPVAPWSAVGAVAILRSFAPLAILFPFAVTNAMPLSLIRQHFHFKWGPITLM